MRSVRLRPFETPMINSARWPNSAYRVYVDNQYCSESTDIGIGCGKIFYGLAKGAFFIDTLGSVQHSPPQVSMPAVEEHRYTLKRGPSG